MAEGKPHFGPQFVTVVVNPEFSVDADEQKAEEKCKQQSLAHLLAVRGEHPNKVAHQKRIAKFYHEIQQDEQTTNKQLATKLPKEQPPRRLLLILQSSVDCRRTHFRILTCLWIWKAIHRQAGFDVFTEVKPRPGKIQNTKPSNIDCIMLLQFLVRLAFEFLVHLLFLIEIIIRVIIRQPAISTHLGVYIINIICILSAYPTICLKRQMQKYYQLSG